MNFTTQLHRSTLTTVSVIKFEGLNGIFVVRENVVGGRILLQTKDEAKADEFIDDYNDDIAWAEAVLDEQWSDHTGLIALLVDTNKLPWKRVDKNGVICVRCVSNDKEILPMHVFTNESALRLIEVAHQLPMS